MFSIIRYISLFILLINEITSRDLRFVFSIFRHGARAPQHGVVNGVDILGNSWSSPGELTEVGMRMHFLLGKRNRQLYKDFVSTNYNPLEIFIRSSDYNRTMMSVQSQLQGFYPPGTGPVLNDFQKTIGKPSIADNFGGFNTASQDALPNRMNIFPVHLMTEIEKQYFFFYGFHLCTPLYNVLHENEKIKEIENYIKNFKSTYEDNLLKAYPSLNITTYHQLFIFMDTFVSGYTQGYAFDELKNNGIDKETLYQSALVFSKLDIYNYYNGDENYRLAQATVRAFWNDIKAWIENRINADSKDDFTYNGYATPKIVLYSTHDVTLGSVATFMKHALDWSEDDLVYPSFASSINFELSKPADKASGLTIDDYEISFNFNDRKIGPYSVKDLFEKVEKKLISFEDLDEYCENESSFVDKVYRRWTIALGVLACFFLIVFIIVLIICIFKTKNSKNQSNLATSNTNKAI